MTIQIQPVPADRRAGLLLAAALFTAVGIVLGTARPAAACSCAMAGAMKEYATVEHAVFTGRAGERGARGVPVEVTQWLWGQGAAPAVWLTANSFGDSAGCGTNPPQPGTSWIWVTWLPGNNGDFGTGLCSPAAQLGTPEGQAMLEDALAVFGASVPPNATAEPTPGKPIPSLTPDPAAAARDARLLLIGGAVILGSLFLFGGLVLVARRRDRPQP